MGCRFLIGVNRVTHYGQQWDKVVLRPCDEDLISPLSFKGILNDYCLYDIIVAVMLGLKVHIAIDHQPLTPHAWPSLTQKDLG